MEDNIFGIIEQLTRHDINKTEAVKKLLFLYNVKQQRELLICDYEHIKGGGLTVGNKYEKIHEHKGMVTIINDFDELMNCNKEAFFKAN